MSLSTLRGIASCDSEKYYNITQTLKSLEYIMCIIYEDLVL